MHIRNNDEINLTDVNMANSYQVRTMIEDIKKEEKLYRDLKAKQFLRDLDDSKKWIALKNHIRSQGEVDYE